MTQARGRAMRGKAGWLLVGLLSSPLTGSLLSGSIVGSLLGGCASSNAVNGAASPVAKPGAATSDGVVLSSGAQSKTLRRSEVVAIVDRGLGEFLSRVELEPHLEAGQFQGFRVLSLNDPDFWAGVDLEPGDVVTKVNGEFLEEPDRAYKAFVGLKQAPELRVEMQRAGQARVLSYAISGAPVAAGVDSDKPGAGAKGAPPGASAVEPKPAAK